jgi:hypothetical protein
MSNCPICNRSIIRIGNHLRKVHGLLYNTTEATTMRDFILFLKLFPISPEDWSYLTKHAKMIERHYKSGETLPTKLFQILYKNFDKYRSASAPKLVILNGFINGKKSINKMECQSVEQLEKNEQPK